FGARPLRRAADDYPPPDPEDYDRHRLFYATAELAMERPLEAVPVGEIAKLAGVGYRRYARLFSSKEELFCALHELAHMRTLAATSGGYFSRETWAERMWGAGRAG